MTISYLSDFLNDAELETIDQFLSAKTYNFSQSIEFLKLEKDNDFLCADLSECDLSDSDIRGFDFTGANLNNCTGTRVTWDHTTILEGADTSGSFLEFEQQRRNFLKKNAKTTKQLNQIQKMDWFGQWTVVAELFPAKKELEPEIPESEKKFIGLEVFKHAKNLTVRIDLMSSLDSVMTEQEWDAFFLSELSAGNIHSLFLDATIRVLNTRTNISPVIIESIVSIFGDNEFVTDLNVFEFVLRRGTQDKIEDLKLKLATEELSEFRRRCLANVFVACGSMPQKLFIYDKQSIFDPLVGIGNEERQFAISRVSNFGFYELERLQAFHKGYEALVAEELQTCESLLNRSLGIGTVGKLIESSGIRKPFRTAMKSIERRSLSVLEIAWREHSIK